MIKWFKIVFAVTITVVTFLYSVFGTARPEITIQDPHAITLPMLTRAFLSHPEFTGNFMKKGDNIPSATQRGVGIELLKNVLNGASTALGDDNDPDNRFIEKVTIPINERVFFFGDFHGSIHTLVRSLWRMVQLGVLDVNLKLQDGCHIVCLGDYVDRGRWGVEVITTLLLLKIKNPGQVFMVAGNHEIGDISIKHGFLDELNLKFGGATDLLPDPEKAGKKKKKDSSDGDVKKSKSELRQEKLAAAHIDVRRLFNDVYEQFFNRLPVALIIDLPDGSHIQACHGGIAPHFQTDKHFVRFISDARNQDRFFVGAPNKCISFYMSEFCDAQDVVLDADEERGGIATQSQTLDYCRTTGITALVRAHQDQEFGCKLFGCCDISEQSLKTVHQQAREQSDEYKQGPYHWTEVLCAAERAQSVLTLSDLRAYPVITLTTAVEARDFPYDCFVCLSAKHEPTFEVYEFFLGRGDRQADRNKKFVVLSRFNRASSTMRVMPWALMYDLIGVTWGDIYNEDLLVRGLNSFIDVDSDGDVSVGPEDSPARTPVKHEHGQVAEKFIASTTVQGDRID